MNLLFIVISSILIVWGTKLLIEGWHLKEWLGMFLVALGIIGMATVLYVALLNFVQ
jgi:hypothetical protein